MCVCVCVFVKLSASNHKANPCDVSYIVPTFTVCSIRMSEMFYIHNVTFCKWMSICEILIRTESQK